jgi:hypothetical protein
VTAQTSTSASTSGGEGGGGEGGGGEGGGGEGGGGEATTGAGGGDFQCATDQIPAPVYEQFVSGLCHEFCMEAVPYCKDSPVNADHGDIDFTSDWCHQSCSDDIHADLEKAANYHCHPKSCEQAWECIEAPPIVVPDLCTELCNIGGACNALALFDLPASPHFCALMCAGPDNLGEVLSCITPPLEAGCDVYSAMDCRDDFVSLNCNHVCRAHGGKGNLCPAESQYRQLFPDEELCMAQCVLLNREEVVGVRFCMEPLDCDASAGCWPPAPHDSSPECDTFCDEILETCPNFEFRTPELCRQWCAQVRQARPEFPGCFDNMDACRLFTMHNVLRCDDVNAQTTCEEYCDKRECCDPSFDADECVNQCFPQVLAGVTEDLANVFLCSSAADSCDAVESCAAGGPLP